MKHYLFGLLFFFVIQTLLSIPPAFSEEKMTNEQLVYILKNEDALLEKRKEAVNQIFDNLNDNWRTSILEALQLKGPTDFSKLFHVYLEEKILANRDQKLLKSLQDILENRSEDVSFRQSALTIMWQADSKNISPVVFRIAENPLEEEELRLSAMERLAQGVESEDLVDIARKILLNKKEYLTMRRICFGFVESKTKKEEVYKLYRDIVLDSSDQAQFRRFLVMKGIRSNVEGFTEILIKIVSNPKDNILLRQAALYGLYSAEEGAAKFLPEIRRSLSNELDPIFRENLNEFIAKVENR